MRSTLLLTALLAISLSLPASAAELRPLAFEEPQAGLATDPRGIWTDDELAQSQVYTRQWLSVATAETDVGEIVVSVLFGDLCSLSECPFRVDLVRDGVSIPVLPVTRAPFDYESACQTLSQFYLSSDGSTLQACGADYPIELPS